MSELTLKMISLGLSGPRKAQQDSRAGPIVTQRMHLIVILQPNHPTRFSSSTVGCPHQRQKTLQHHLRLDPQVP